MLGVHELNHPEATHIVTELPPQQPLPLPTAGKWHLHGSPPCNKVSRINQDVTPEQRKHGLSLVRWYLRYALASSATTWSMEQVPAECVLKVVKKFKRRHPGKLDYCVVNCYDLGVPQTRKRLIAGTPELIDRLRRRRTVRRCVADVIARPGRHAHQNRGDRLRIVQVPRPQLLGRLLQADRQTSGHRHRAQRPALGHAV